MLHRHSTTTTVLRLAATDIPPGLSETTRQAVEQAIDLAFIAGFRVVIGIAGVLAFLSAIVAAVMLKQPVH